MGMALACFHTLQMCLIAAALRAAHLIRVPEYIVHHLFGACFHGFDRAREKRLGKCDALHDFFIGYRGEHTVLRDHLPADLIHIPASLCHALDIIRNEVEPRRFLRLLLGQIAAGKQLGDVLGDSSLQLFEDHQILLKGLIILGGSLAVKDELQLVQRPVSQSDQALQLQRDKVHGSGRFIEQIVIQILRLIGGLEVLVFPADDGFDDLDHDRDEWQPCQRTYDIESRVCIGDLPGNDIDLTAARRDVLHELCKERNDAQADQTAADIETAVRDRGALRIFRLPDRCQNGCDRRTDVISQKDRDRTGKADDTAAAISCRLGRKILQHGDRSRAALYHQRHHAAEEYTQDRCRRDFCHQVDKDAAACERLHHMSHDLDPFKEQSEREDDHADILQLLCLADKLQHEADENDGINVVAELERQELCCHRGPDIRAEDDGDRLRQCHQSGTDEADRHDGGRRAALQDCRHQRSGERPHDRILCQKAEDLFHALPGSFLQGITHRIHAVQEKCQAADQAKADLDCFIHSVLLLRKHGLHRLTLQSAFPYLYEPWETLIQSQSRISYGFLYIASSSSSLNSSLFASADSLLCIKIQE